jgi:hypothetical protein
MHDPGHGGLEHTDMDQLVELICCHVPDRAIDCGLREQSAHVMTGCLHLVRETADAPLYFSLLILVVMSSSPVVYGLSRSYQIWNLLRLFPHQQSQHVFSFPGFIHLFLFVVASRDGASCELPRRMNIPARSRKSSLPSRVVLNKRMMVSI